MLAHINRAKKYQRIAAILILTLLITCTAVQPAGAAVTTTGKWSLLGGVYTGIDNGAVYDIETVNFGEPSTGWYIGGSFENAGGNDVADKIAKINKHGTFWSALYNPLNGDVYDIEIYNDVLYAGGSFTNAGGDANADYIAKFTNADGWQAVGTGLGADGNTVYDIEFKNGVLYAGGAFTNAGDVYGDYIAKFESGSWSSLGGLGSNLVGGWVYDIEFDNNGVLHAAGNFLNAGGDVNADRVAKYEGGAWSALGADGTASLSNGTVYDIEFLSFGIYGSIWYAGGSFTDAGGDTNADYIARLTSASTAWGSLGGAGTGLNGIVYEINTHNYVVHAGGAFTDAGGDVNADHIAKFSSGAWSSLGGAGTGLNDTVRAIEFDGNLLIVGGDFTDAGGNIYADRIAKYVFALTATSQGKYDGWILESSETSGKGGTKNSTGKTLRVGDDANNRQYRSILSFNTAAIPDDAVITNVYLKVKKAGVVGTNPYKTHKDFYADIRKNKFGTSPKLQLSDFQAAASHNLAGLMLKTTASAWYQTKLNSPALPYIKKNGTTQFRLRFTKGDNNDSGADYLKFYSGNAGTNSRPKLIVEYYVP